jgi:ribosomal protein S18 acetylase RimI-like enzyme
MAASSVRPLLAEDLPTLHELFRDFPHKKHQQREQGIAANALADFFVAAEERRLRKVADANGEPVQWVAVGGSGTVVALAGLDADAWHSSHYPWQFGRIAPFLTWRALPDERAALLDAVLAAAAARGMNHVTARVDGAEYGAAQTLESRGFYLVDVSVKCSGALADVPALAPPSRAAGMRIRQVEPADVGAIRAIAASSHAFNHYYNDPWLDPEATNRLFEAWIERCAGGLASHLFVLDHHGAPAGFVIYLRPASFNAALGTRLAILDFVCLAPVARGGGVGSWLIADTLRRLGPAATHVELRTSHHNWPALKCYLGLGMRVVSNDLVLHRHATAS